jgi:hypothetical protein
MLVAVKPLHTLVWAFMVACIAAIWLFAAAGRFGPGVRTFVASEPRARPTGAWGLEVRGFRPSWSGRSSR